MDLVISASSKETFDGLIFRRQGNSFKDLTLDTVTITAAVSVVDEDTGLSVAPANGSFFPVEHVIDSGDGVYAGVQVGPGSDIGTLAPGTYDVWFRVQTETDDVRIKATDRLVIY